jgi:hypothetical protein
MNSDRYMVMLDESLFLFMDLHGATHFLQDRAPCIPESHGVPEGEEDRCYGLVGLLARSQPHRKPVVDPQEEAEGCPLHHIAP